ncbi:tRNA lysidine(34) synthetase TilS [Diaminobutyricibacter sp. McL0608]|uniref:tRNA lysidine(34) synthetase TilS n=1 Tax=Leifsonia sp. McL0608 TaxID=3143537 RepID=UPI0031F2FD2C
MHASGSPARRPRLTPPIADVRRAVREALTGLDGVGLDGEGPDAVTLPESGDARFGGLVLVGLSGGADSLALAAATAFEAPRAGIRAGAIIIDHGLQAGSAEVAEAAAEQARAMDLDPVIVSRVAVTAFDGPEASARSARFAAFDRAMEETGASHVLLAHTLDDQAETVLLGLARGSGPTSLRGMAAETGPYLRPLLGIRRATTSLFCADSGLVPWEDPHNADTAFTRVRVRSIVLPVLEAELGPGVAEALARTAEQLREDSDALDALALEWALELTSQDADGAVALDVRGLAADPPALRQRIIRLVVANEFGVSLERVHTLAVAELITDWHGQKALTLPGVRVVRQNGLLIFTQA